MLGRSSIPKFVVAALVAGCAKAPTPPPRPEGPPPARLAVDAPIGANVYVDDVFVGQSPLPAPVDADPGPHRLAVGMNGYHPHIAEIVLERGGTRKVTIDLDMTPQRIGAWIAIATGAASVSAGIVLGVLAVVEHRAAEDILDFSSNVGAEELDQAFLHIAARDDYRLGSGIAAGAGLGLFVVGAILFAFDEPELLPEAPVQATPLLSPALLGGAASVRF